jgi:hypothetical protein
MVKVDGPSIRSALRSALGDADDDVRAEVLVGLVQRRDPCSFDEVVCALTSESVGRLAVQAAAILGDNRLADVLTELSDWWDVDPTALEWAQYRCSLGRTTREVEAMSNLDHLVGDLHPGSWLVFESALEDGEISVRAQRANRADQETRTWSFHQLMIGCGNDPHLAAHEFAIHSQLLLK